MATRYHGAMIDHRTIRMLTPDEQATQREALASVKLRRVPPRWRHRRTGQPPISVLPRPAPAPLQAGR